MPRHPDVHPAVLLDLVHPSFQFFSFHTQIFLDGHAVGNVLVVLDGNSSTVVLSMADQLAVRTSGVPIATSGKDVRWFVWHV